MMQATEFVTDRHSKKPDPKLRDAIEKDAYQHGLILLPCGDSAMRYIPALNIPRDVLDAGLDVLDECFKRAARGAPSRSGEFVSRSNRSLSGDIQIVTCNCTRHGGRAC